MKVSERKEMYDNISRHGEKLLSIFPQATIQEPLRLCQKLRQYETRAEICATDLCNGGPEEKMNFADASLVQIEKSVKKLLGITDDNIIFINRDPRGYALKITSEFSADKDIYKDWGGYGIIAPDFTPNNY